MTALPATQKESATNAITKQLRGNLQTYALVIALVVIWGLFGVLTNGMYLSPQNVSNLFRQMTITAIMSVGMVLVIVHGSIDLSVGRLAGFVSVIVAILQLRTWHQRHCPRLHHSVFARHVLHRHARQHVDPQRLDFGRDGGEDYRG
jgi:ABC-type xylose transport system permease subunit